MLQINQFKKAGFLNIKINEIEEEIKNDISIIKQRKKWNFAEND